MKSYQYTKRNNNNSFKPDPVIITTDSDEEERAINYEINCIRNEFEETELKLRRLRYRLRRNYERLEKIQMKREITQRERQIRRELVQKWLPRLKYNQKKLVRIEQNVLNSISAPIQYEDKREQDRFLGLGSDEDDGILKYSANEILSSLCHGGKHPLNNNNNEKQN